MMQGSAAPIEFFGCAGDYLELAGSIHRCVEEVLGSGQVLQGPAVDRFEAEVARHAGRRHAVAVGSGTDALFFALVALGIGPGDDVLVPDITFLASATAILRTGARPLFVDVDDSLSIDFERAASKLGPATRAMVVVHLFGAMADVVGAEAFARQHGLALVEDFAQSFGASRDGRRAGSMGEVSATSFDPTKVLGAPGSGGALVTDDEEIAQRARRLRLHGKQGPAFLEPGYNSQLPTLAAAILGLKLERHGEWTRRRADIAQRYLEGLSGLPVAAVPVASDVAHVWHKFVVLTDDRDALAHSLTSAGVPTRIHYERPLHREPLFRSEQPDAEFPRALSHCRRALSLPIHSHMSRQQVEHVVQAVVRHYA